MIEPFGPTPTGDEPPALRRPSARSAKFTPRDTRPPAAADAVLQRNVLRSAAGGKGERQTSRRHVIAGDLPAWEPLPPGELFLSR